MSPPNATIDATRSPEVASAPELPTTPSPARPGRRRRSRRAIGAITVVVVLAAASGVTWWFGLRDDAADASADTTQSVRQLVEVTTGTFTSTVSAEGTVAAAEAEDLSFASAGTVTAVNVAVGDEVTAGQVLATIDSAELEADLADAQATYAEAEATLTEDQDDDASDEQIAADETRLAVAYDDMAAAYTALGGRDLVATVDGTVTTLDLAVGDELGSGGSNGSAQTGSASGTGNSNAAIGSSGQTPSSSESSSAQVQIVSTGAFEIELAVDSTEIDSIEVGQPVAITEAVSSTASTGFGPGGGFPGGAAPTFGAGGAGPMSGQFPGQTQLASTRTATGDADADSTDADSTDAGSAATITSDAAAATGTVTAVDRIADASSGVASYAVTVSFEDATDSFFIGTSVVADITTSERTDVVQLPIGAVTVATDGSTVKLAVDGDVDGETDTVAVTTGETSATMIEVTGGVEPGDRVVVERTTGGPGGGRTFDGSQNPGAGPFSGEFPTGLAPDVAQGDD